jgi:YVTN family beta-propeller protein
MRTAGSFAGRTFAVTVGVCFAVLAASVARAAGPVVGWGLRSTRVPRTPPCRGPVARNGEISELASRPRRNYFRRTTIQRTRTLAFLLLAVLSIGGAGSAIAAPFVLASDVPTGTVRVIDVSTNSVATSVPVAASSLLGIALAPDGASVYVGGYSGTVWVIDTAAGVVTDAISVGWGPRAFAFTRDGALAYVVDQFVDVVWVIDTATKTVIGSLDLPEDSYSAIAIAPDDSRLYVVGTVGDSLAIVDPSANRVIAKVRVGGYPSAVALSPDGAFAYVTNQFGGVSVVETSTATVIDTIQSGPSQSIAIMQDGRLAYVTNGSNNTVSVVDLIARQVVGAPIPVGLHPHGPVITPDQKFVYVTTTSCRGGCVSPSDYYGSVAVIETATNTVVATIPVRGSPSWLTIAPNFTLVPPPECADGVDNDADGGADWGPIWGNDLGCDSPFDESERSAALACDDGIDNDGDGHIDYPDDPGCPGTIENPECDDGIDNDGDGLEDFPADPGCESPNAPSEFSENFVCDDGIDNDGDGRTDFPLDPGCTDRSDGSELVLFADGGSHILDGSSAPLEDTVLVAALEVLGYGYHYYDPTEVRLDEGGAILSDLQISRSIFEMTGGSVGGDITVSDYSEAEIVSGAVTGDIDVWDASRLVLQGGLLSGTLRAHDQSVVEVHGSGFNFPNGAMTAVAGTLTGTFADGTPLSLPFARDAEATIWLPEPEQVTSLLAGCVLLISLARRRARAEVSGAESR